MVTSSFSLFGKNTIYIAQIYHQSLWHEFQLISRRSRDGTRANNTNEIPPKTYTICESASRVAPRRPATSFLPKRRTRISFLFLSLSLSLSRYFTFSLTIFSHYLFLNLFFFLNRSASQRDDHI